MRTESSSISVGAGEAADLRSNNAPALPATGFVRQRQVLKFIPISKSTLWRRVQARTFPAPIKLSPGITAWRVEEVRHWIRMQGEGGVARGDN